MTEAPNASEAFVTTAKPSAYLKQLCRHFGHKLEVTFDDDRGVINFSFGRCLLAAEGDGLRLRAEAASADELRRVEDVTGSHLVRFGRRDELTVEWKEPGA